MFASAATASRFEASTADNLGKESLAALESHVEAAGDTAIIGPARGFFRAAWSPSSKSATSQPHGSNHLSTDVRLPGGPARRTPGVGPCPAAGSRPGAGLQRPVLGGRSEPGSKLYALLPVGKPSVCSGDGFGRQPGRLLYDLAIADAAAAARRRRSAQLVAPGA